MFPLPHPNPNPNPIHLGTIDAILCSDGANANIKATLKEASRCLKPGGTFVIFSHAGPDERMAYLELDAYGWEVANTEFVRPSVTEVEGLPADDPNNLLFMYTCKKAEKTGK